MFAIKLLMLLCFCSFSVAEPKAGDGGVAIKKAQGLIRQLSQEKTALETEKSGMLAEKFQLEARIRMLEDGIRKLQPLQGEVERYKSVLETTRTSLDSQLDAERREKQNLLQKHNDVVVKANAIYADNQLLVQAVKERELWITQCTAANQALRSLDQDMLKKYREKGFFEQLGDLDVVTGIGRMEAENVVEDYQYRLQQLRITPFQDKNEKNPDSSAENATATTPEAGQ